MFKLFILAVLAVFLVTGTEAGCICYQFVDNWDGLPSSGSELGVGTDPGNPFPNLAAAGWSIVPAQQGAIVFFPPNAALTSLEGGTMTAGPTGHVAIVTAVAFGTIQILGANQGCGVPSAAFGGCMNVAGCPNVNYINALVPVGGMVYYYKAGVAHLEGLASGNLPTTTNNTRTYSTPSGPSMQPSSPKHWEVPVIVVACVVGVALFVAATVVGVLLFRKRAAAAAAAGNESMYQQMRKPLNNEA